MKTYVDAEKLREYTGKLVNKLKTIFPGAPLTAATVADMTEQDRVYVYVGSEEGYTNGDWYYWDGEAWADGGVYNATALVTDPTLSIEGEAADAEATGAQLAAINHNLRMLDLTAQTWNRGTLVMATGKADTSNQYGIYTSNYIPVNPGDTLSVAYGDFTGLEGATSILFRVFEYSTDSYTGFIQYTFLSSDSPKRMTIGSTTQYIRVYLYANPTGEIVVPLDGYKYFSAFWADSAVIRAIDQAGENDMKWLTDAERTDLTDSGNLVNMPAPRFMAITGGSLKPIAGNIPLDIADGSTRRYIVTCYIYYRSSTSIYKVWDIFSQKGLEHCVGYTNSSHKTDIVWTDISYGPLVGINEKIDILVPSKELTLTSGIITTAGRFNSTSTQYIRSFGSKTLPEIQKGDYCAVYGDYEILWVVIFNYNYLGPSSFYAYAVPEDKHYYSIPDDYAGKYFAVVLQKTSMIGEDVSSYVEDAMENVRYYSPADARPDDPVPYYYKDHADAKIAEVNKKSLQISKNGGQVCFLTDYHREQNSRNSPALVKYMMDGTGIRTMIFGGDAMDSGTTQEAGYKKLVEYTKDFAEVLSVGRIYNIVGNHEQNNPNASPEHMDRIIPDGAIYQLYTESNVATLKPLWYDSTYFGSAMSTYMDDERAKMRYYFLGCSYNAFILDKEIKAIATSFGDVPEGFGVIVFSHMGLKWDSDEDESIIVGRVENLLDCGKALNDGQSVTIWYSESVSGTFDYTGKSREFLGIISGHCHYDDFVMYENRFPVIATTTDARKQTQSHHVLPREKGTVSEQAFDVVQFDMLSRTIYMTRVGAGASRTFHCAPSSEESYTPFETDAGWTWTWTSSDTSVATVDSVGAVTPAAGAAAGSLCVISAINTVTDGEGNTKTTYEEYWVYEVPDQS